MWSDAHNHLADARLRAIPTLRETMRAAGVVRSVVNATREEDWAAVETMAAELPEEIIPAFGIHPWHAHTARLGWEDRLAALLEKHPTATVGEIGVDGWVSAPPPDVQAAVFERQLRLARVMERPCTIHCLQAWGALWKCFDCEPPPTRFLMHSFGGSIEIARRLLPLGAWFSFSGYFLHPRKAKVLEVFRELPRERILLETDAPDMLPPDTIPLQPCGGANHPANLPAIGAGLAEVLGVSPEELAALTTDNLARFLARD